MNDNRLPLKFKTWNELWASVKHRIQPDHKIIQWSEFGNPDVYEFGVDYIKARCYDEFIELYKRVERADPYDSNTISAWYFEQQIDKILHLNNRNPF